VRSCPPAVVPCRAGSSGKVEELRLNVVDVVEAGLPLLEGPAVNSVVVMQADGDPGVRIDEHDGVVVSLLVAQSPSSLDPLGPARGVSAGGRVSALTVPVTSRRSEQ
jgi:hypothetical protein